MDNAIMIVRGTELVYAVV